MHRKARKHKTDHLWNLYRTGLKDYKNIIRTAKRSSWKSYVNKISSIPSAARLHKVMKSLNSNPGHLGSLKKPDGSFTSSPRDTLTTLAEALLPIDNSFAHSPIDPGPDHVNIINSLITPNRLRKVCMDMAPNKSPGPDNIRLNMINACWDSISPCLLHLFKHSLRLGITPDEWNEANGVVIAKPLKDDYTNVRAFRIISLTSTLQKIMEKLIIWYIEADIGLSNLTTDNQHGFKRNFSTDSALHKITNKIEFSLSAGNQALGLFLDIEGAFDNISYDAIYHNLNNSGIPITLCNWIYYMVSHRVITLTLNGISITRTISRGCPQGGVLSPFLWNLTLNDLLSNHNLDTSFIQAFADDLSIIVGGIDIPTIRAICQRYLIIIDKWCTTIGVKLSSLKTQAIMFTRKRLWTLDKPLSLKGINIHLVNEVKYLGITLDSKLLWRPHIDATCNKAIRNLHTIRSACSKKWGLKPSYTQWIYEQIIIPALSHGSVVWSHIIDSRKWATNMLNHVQRSAILLITGAISSTPTCYLEVLTQLPPLDLRIHSSSLKTFLRLNITSSASNGLRDGKLKSHSILLSDQIKKILPPLSLIDIAPASLNLTQSFITIILERSLALVQIPLLHKLDTLVGYTDGSVKNNLAGAGFILYLNSSTISEHFIKLGNTTTIFQAELLAILHLCIHLSNSNHEASELHICIDSKAVLHALSGTITRSHLIMDTLKALNFLSRTFSITLHWVPAHSGIQGNDLADTLANKGSDSPPIGPPPFAPYTHSTLSNILDSYFSRLHYNRILIFRSSSDFHQSNIISFFDRHLDIKQHNRDNTRILTHLFTGCSYLRYFQNKIGNESNSICKKCDEDKETTAHYLTSCPAFSSHRKYYFGDYTIREDTFHLIYSISNIVGFARATKYLDFYEPP